VQSQPGQDVEVTSKSRSKVSQRKIVAKGTKMIRSNQAFSAKYLGETNNTQSSNFSYRTVFTVGVAIP